MCIRDRAKTDSTIIRRGVKLDNLIQIGHNVQIGENTVSSAQTGIAGTSKAVSYTHLNSNKSLNIRVAAPEAGTNSTTRKDSFARS